MENRQENIRLSYVKGGAPGVLVVFSGFEAVTSIITCLLNVISVLAAGGLAGILTLVLSAVGAVLSFKLWTGLRNLHKGEYSGADTAEEAVRGRRVMLWVAYGLILLVQMISLFRAPGGAGILALMLIIAVSMAVMIPINLYYRKAEGILGHIKYESTSKEPIRPESLNAFSVLSIIFAVLLMVIPLLYLFGPYISRSLEYDLNRRWLSSDMYDVFETARNLILLLFYLMAARFLVANICFRGFMRAHSRLSEGFAPSGLENSFSICVLGSVMFGWVALTSLSSCLSVSQYLHEYGRYISSHTAYSQAQTELIFSVIGAVSLAVALMLRKGRTIPGMVGSAAMIVSRIFLNPTYSGRYGLYGVKDNTFRLLRISNYLVIAFYAIVIAALLIRLVRNVPKAVPLVLLGLAVAAAVLACAARWPDTAGSRSTVSKILLFINSLFMNGGVSLVAMAGIAWLIRTERETKIPVRNQPDETEKPF